MKRESILVCIGLLAFNSFICNGQQQASNPPPVSGTQVPVMTTPATGPKAQLAFKETTHDFGEIKQGEKVAYTYTFTNTGQAPLVLAAVQTTCGCTSAGWDKKPIAPGATGQVTLTFNSEGKSGRQMKVATVLSNAVNTEERITLQTIVLPANTTIPLPTQTQEVPVKVKD
jgi:hypothetical protein